MNLRKKNRNKILLRNYFLLLVFEFELGRALKKNTRTQTIQICAYCNFSNLFHRCLNIQIVYLYRFVFRSLFSQTQFFSSFFLQHLIDDDASINRLSRLASVKTILYSKINGNVSQLFVCVCVCEREKGNRTIIQI